MTFGGTTYGSTTYGGASINTIIAEKTVLLDGTVAITRQLDGVDNTTRTLVGDVE